MAGAALPEDSISPPHEDGVVLTTPTATSSDYQSTSDAFADTDRPKKRRRPEPSREDANRTPTPSTQNGTTPRPFELSYFGIAPFDEFTRDIGTWIWEQARDLGHVEVEAKIGVLLDHNRRFNLPVLTECILARDGMARFDANITARQHACYNQLLNSRVGPPQDAVSHNKAPVHYQHTRETDYHHPSPDKDWSTKIRVTKVHPDKHNLAFTVLKDPPEGLVCKRRIADRNIFSPRQPFDFRISINTETPLNSYPTTQPTGSRYKDRMSYEHQFLRVDLTQVKKDNAPSHSSSYEIEVEISDMKLLMAEGRKHFVDNDKESRYFDMIQVFLNTVRMLQRNAGPA